MRFWCCNLYQSSLRLQQWSCDTVDLRVQPTRVAQVVTSGVPPPEWSRDRPTVDALTTLSVVLRPSQVCKTKTKHWNLVRRKTDAKTQLGTSKHGVRTLIRTLLCEFHHFSGLNLSTATACTWIYCTCFWSQADQVFRILKTLF